MPPPTCTSPAIPTPPSTIKAPVVVLVLAVVLFKLVTPVTSNVPPTSVLPVVLATVNLLVSIVKPPLSAVAPVTVNDPLILVFGVIVTR